MKSTCRVSILVPVCNVERYVRECLESLVSQTLDDIQIICINDGSTDSSLDILQEYQRIDDRVEIISKPNSGYGDSMNKGLAQARGEYIGIVESDDFAAPNMFEELYKLAKRNDADVVKSNFLAHEQNQLAEDDQPVDNLGDGPFDTVFCPLDHQGIFLWRPAIWSGLYKKSFLSENGIEFLPTPGASFQDTSFNFKVFASAKRAYLTKSAYLHYRTDNANSSVKSQKKVFCICDEYAEIWRFAHERNLDQHSLGKLIPFIQYGGYRWNLDRLTPALQLGFYRSFVDEFLKLQAQGLLEKSSFNEQSWTDLTEMLADPDRYFQTHYGPQNVETTYFLPLCQAGASEQTILSIASALDDDDELLCALDEWTDATARAFDNARAKDKRIFKADEFYSSPSAALIDVERLRGAKVGVIMPSCVRHDDKNLADDMRAFSAWKPENGGFFKSESILGCTSSQLAALSAPVFLSLLVCGAYSGEVRKDQVASRDWLPTPSEKCALPDYRASAEALPRLFSWANNIAEGMTFDQHAQLLKEIGPLWRLVRNNYRTMEYSDRLDAQMAPSPQQLHAAIAASEANNAGQQPDLSVIIPVFNAQPYIEECLRSVLGQTLSSIEVICIDDGSTDDSLRLLIETSGKDARIRVATQVNGGAGSARNRGIDLARGRWLTFIDPDDYYPDSNVLERLLTAAEAHGVKVCGGSFSTVYPDGTKKEKFTGMQAFYTFRKGGFRTPEDDQTDYGWIRFIYRKDLLVDNQIRFPEMQWYEDPLFFADAMDVTDKYFVIPDVVYCYREDFKEPDWNVGKTRDLLKGISANLEYAKRHGYARLYGSLVRRLDEDYYPALVKNISDEEVFLRLVDIQSNLDLSLLPSTRESHKRYYLLRVLNDLMFFEIGNTAIVRVARKISESKPYKSLQSIRERIGD